MGLCSYTTEGDVANFLGLVERSGAGYHGSSCLDGHLTDHGENDW